MMPDVQVFVLGVIAGALGTALIMDFAQAYRVLNTINTKEDQGI